MLQNHFAKRREERIVTRTNVYPRGLIEARNGIARFLSINSAVAGIAFVTTHVYVRCSCIVEVNVKFYCAPAVCDSLLDGDFKCASRNNFLLNCQRHKAQLRNTCQDRNLRREEADPDIYIVS